MRMKNAISKTGGGDKMKFLITVDVPEAKKEEIVPKEIIQMFETFARYYQDQRDNGVLMKDTALHIRDGEPSLSVRVQSINVQGEVTRDE